MHTFFAINRLSAYIDGELPDHEAAEVERAIAADPTVRGEYERMLETVELLRTRGPLQAPSHLHAAILDRVADEPDPIAGFWARLLAPFHALPMEAVGVVFAVVAVVVLINQQPGGEPAPPAAAPAVTVEQSLEEDLQRQPVLQEPPKLASRPDQPAPPAPEAGLPAKPFGAYGGGSTSAGRGDVVPATSTSERSTGKKNASSKSAAPQVKKVSPPEQAYVPEWEQQGQDHTAGEGRPNELYAPEPVYYRLNPTDEHGLMQLQKLVARYGGSLKTKHGASINPRVLSNEDNFEELRADVPAERVQEFVAALNQLGLVTTVEAHELRLYGGGVVQIRIDVLFNP